ncbi:MAG TPA: cupin domain-containing protein [Candidatus Acidoferrales bacterium]|nr:cupin domain-containing protein [Candidatus Acidoferrales bacterium]
MSSPSASFNAPVSEERVFSPGASSSLEWLIHPVSKANFFERYWEKQTLVIKRNQPNYFNSLLSLDEVDRVLTTLDRRYPDVTLKNASREITSDDYTVGGDALDVAKVYQLFGEGSTVTLAFLDTVVPSLTSFCRGLESEFSFPFQANVYMTPPGAQGAKPHYDTHDVFVLQVAGSKKWNIYGTPVELPLPSQDFDSAIHEQGATTLEFELHAGDIAYIPRGIVHDARSTDVVSLHITAGVLRYTWTDLLLEFVASAALNDPAFRKALPPGFARPNFDRANARETLRNLLQKISSRADFDAALDASFDHFVDQFMSVCPPLLRGQMGQLEGLERLTLDSAVGARQGVITRLQANRESVTVECYGRKVIFPTHAHEALQFALNHAKFTVRDLPGDLDEAGKLALVRRLIREGLVASLPT